MKSFIQTLRNIYKIPELRSRIAFTLLLIMAYRLGSYIILPGVNSAALQASFAAGQGEGILGLINTFVGGAFGRGSIFALGIMPYISASIIIQLMTVALPNLQKLQKEGESGQRKLNQYTRYLTIVITAAQAGAYLVNLRGTYGNAVMQSSPMFWTLSVFILTASTMFLVWMGERITDKGIGNGVSLIITIGIIADLPKALITEIQINPVMIFYIEMIALALVTMAVVALTVAVRKIPVNYARRMVSNKMTGGMTPTLRQYIPLKLNSANVMPIIFAQAIMFIPGSVAQLFPESDFWGAAGGGFSNWKGFWYNFVFGILIILFTYFYTSITVNPNDIADQLKRNGGFIPGVKPGKKTSEYIDAILTRITLPGSIFLALVAVMPAFAAAFNVSDSFAQFFGGTSLLIMIGVVLDTLQQVESYLLMRKYDGLMKTGRIKGRNNTMVPTPVSY
jgi:preprotein translocase subunit SecY